VPTVLIDGRPLTEVAGILFYLARRFPQAALLPADDVESEARVVSWMSFIAATIHPARRQGLEHSRRVYAVAEQRLGEQEWAVGRYSIADIHLFRLFWRFRGMLGAEPSEFPHLSAHYERMMARPAVRKTIERLRSATNCRHSEIRMRRRLHGPWFRLIAGETVRDRRP
jgi:glutathione S-transferase